MAPSIFRSHRPYPGEQSARAAGKDPPAGARVQLEQACLVEYKAVLNRSKVLLQRDAQDPVPAPRCAKHVAGEVQLEHTCLVQCRWSQAGREDLLYLD